MKGAALCMAVAAAASLGACGGVAADTAGRAVQVTHGMYLDPSMSPDGARMVVVALVDGREQLAVMNTDGSSVIMLTNDAYDHEDPSWSPDGRSIAFMSKEDDGEVIYVMDADGANRRALTPAAQRNIHPTWSPDSTEILYCSNDDLAPPAKNDANIYAVDVASGAIRMLISGGVNTYANMSPDGSMIAFRRMVEEANSEVWLANADGSGAHNLTAHPAFDGWPSWSPDGRWIAFASDRDGNQQVHVMRADGTDVRRVAETPGRGTAPQFSRDGANIFFPVCTRAGCEIYRAPAPTGDEG